MSVIGIDLGGTMVKGGFFDRGVLFSQNKRPSNGRLSREAIIRAVKDEIRGLWRNDVERIGIVSAGDIDPIQGVCTYATDNLMGWTGTPIKAIFEEEFKVPVYVENDAIGALIGEASLFIERKDITLLTFGTGVGGASFVNGLLDRSERAKWGHRVLIEDGRRCNCGKSGCAETYLSASALLQDGKAAIPALSSTIELMSLFKQGDKRAERVVRRYGDWLNAFLKMINSEIHPSMIILGGGLMDAKDVIEPLISKENANHSFAKLGNTAGIVGASALPLPY